MAPDGMPIIIDKGRVPIKAYTNEIEPDCYQQLLDLANSPVPVGHVSCMPDQNLWPHWLALCSLFLLVPPMPPMPSSFQLTSQTWGILASAKQHQGVLKESYMLIFKLVEPTKLKAPLDCIALAGIPIFSQDKPIFDFCKPLALPNHYFPFIYHQCWQSDL